MKGKLNITLLTVGLLMALFWFTSKSLAVDDAGQKILDLRKQIEDLTKQAAIYKANVKKKESEGNTLQRQIELLNNQVLKLQTQILLTSKEVDSTNLEITNIEGHIYDAQDKINHQRASIAGLLSNVYKADNLDLLVVLLKSDKLSEFANQAQAINDITSKIASSLAEIKTEKAKLEDNQKQLVGKKDDLETLNKQQLEQKTSLAYSKEGKDRLLVQTRGQEQQYQVLLSQAEQKEKDFYDQLKDLESQAVKNGSFIVHVTATGLPSRGSFMWPEDDFLFTQGYGMTKYARRGAYGGAPHNGVDVSGGYGSAIHPVSDGQILASGFNKGFGNWVAVRHDAGIVSIYAHLNRSSGLANGTTVSHSSVIGYEGSTGNSTASHCHLSIYRDFFTYLKGDELYFNYFAGSINPLDYLQPRA